MDIILFKILLILTLTVIGALIWKLVKVIYKLNDHEDRIQNIYKKLDYINENIDGLNHKSVDNEEKILFILSDIRKALERVETSIDKNRQKEEDIENI